MVRAWLVCAAALLLTACNPAGMLLSMLMGGYGDRPGPPPPEWRKLSDGDGPAGRGYPTMVGALEDATHNPRLIVFGGKGAGGALGDTWLFDLVTRTWRRGADGPPRWGHGAVYDGFKKVMWVFGGQQPKFLSDTWQYDPAADKWTEVKPSGAIPPARYGHSTAYYSPGTYNLKPGMIVSHGFAEDGRHDDTWLLDLDSVAWRELTSAGPRPVKRCLHSADMDSARGLMYLFGGCASGFGGCPLNDLWVFDTRSGKWTEMVGGGDVPKARSSGILVADYYDLYVHGGAGGGEELLRFDTGRRTWQTLATGGPGQRSEHAATGDFVSSGTLETDGDLYVFGGTRGGELLADLWVARNLATLPYQRKTEGVESL
ncbi:MAG: hypothetical protein FJZ01_05990 [Candidatus Sericytochromatia bacterium]|nr:hypothetical protein [Candidatus Tanganyikabacteria bacterium]